MLHYEQFTDKTLVEMMKDDDYKSFDALYCRYRGKVYHFIVTLSHGDYYMAEDTVQVVFVKLWEHRHELFVTHSISGWLYTVSRNHYLSHVSRKLNEELALTAMKEESVDEVDNVSDEVERRLLMEEVERVIQLLPPARQKVYRMKHLEHFSQKEISERLSISENTVESYLRQSAKFVQMMLKPYKSGFLNAVALWLASSLLTFIFR